MILYPVSISLDGGQNHQVLNSVDLSDLKELIEALRPGNCIGCTCIPMDGYEEIAANRMKQWKRV